MLADLNIRTPSAVAAAALFIQATLRVVRQGSGVAPGQWTVHSASESCLQEVSTVVGVEEPPPPQPTGSASDKRHAIEHAPPNPDRRFMRNLRIGGAVSPRPLGGSRE